MEFYRTYNYGVFADKENAESYRKIMEDAAGKAAVVRTPVYDEVKGDYLPEINKESVVGLKKNKNWMVEEYGERIYDEFLFKSDYFKRGERIKGLKKHIKMARLINAGRIDEVMARLEKMDDSLEKRIYLHHLGNKDKLNLEDKQKIVNDLVRHVDYLQRIQVRHKRKVMGDIRMDLYEKFGEDVGELDLLEDFEPTVQSRFPDPRPFLMQQQMLGQQ